jgi:hypothetical protein
VASKPIGGIVKEKINHPLIDIAVLEIVSLLNNLDTNFQHIASGLCKKPYP